MFRLQHAGEERMSARSRIALCHLESLIGLPALNALFADIGDHIDLVVLSNRFGGAKHGGTFRQLVKGIRQTGLRMTFWLGFDIISAQVVSRVARLVTLLTRRPPALRSVRALAAQYGADVVECGDVNSSEMVERLRDAGVDLVIVMNFDQILKSEFITTPRGGVVNLHPSLLPSLRGPCPVFWALAQGHPEVGVTLHIIDNAEIDTGPIVDQTAMATDPRLSVAEITSMLFLTGARFVRPVVRKLAEGRCLGVPQPSAAASYRGFPDRSQIAAATARGVRLFRLRHVAALLAASCGLMSWTR